MATHSASTATFLAISTDVFSGLVNAALLVCYPVIWLICLLADRLDHMLRRGEFKAVVAALIFALAAIFFLSRRQVTRERVEVCWNGPGKVLLFPCRTSHSRRFPHQHSFSHSYLMVGVPVGFEGDAGGTVSVVARGKQGLFPWLTATLRGGWLTIDACDYLERGKPELSLRKKLSSYLRTQGVDPAAYPYAYLVTAGRFLGYHFNPVSFWYLYDVDKRLAAMVLEVNNTFDERHMYFLTADDGSEEEQSKCSSTQTVFKQSWAKSFHVSPFNSRKGSYTLTATDPLSPDMQGIRASITLLSSKGHRKMVAELTSTGAAIDPCTMTTYQKYRFLASWGWVGLVTYPRILLQAFRLYFRRNLHVWYRPEPLNGTISRRATSTERRLEPIFCRYLQHLIEQSVTSLSIEYHPASDMTAPELFLSPAARAQAQAQAHDRTGNFCSTTDHLEFHVLTPAFYTNFTRSTHNPDAFIRELNDTQTIWVSGAILLPRLFTAKRLPPTAPISPGVWETVYMRLVHLLRAKSLSGVRRGVGLSEMDVYVMGYEPPRERERYWKSVLRVLLAERIAFGSDALLRAQWVLMRVGVAWVLWWVIS